MKSRIIKRGTAAAAALTLGLSVAASLPVSAASSSITDQMGAGWNLGNTFDATGGSGLSTETSWGNPKTTKAMIDAVHDAGFQTIRIPISWAKHMDSNYTIDSAWMARVKEVVDYAYDDGMYVIINIHHDNMWIENGKIKGSNGSIGFYPDSENKTASLKFINSVWSQVAEEFKNYDEKLIFETLNEPRLSGTSYEWSSPQWDTSATMTDSANTINEFNQQAVNTIRDSGGYNKTRYIMAPGYAASVGSAVADIYKLPTDPVSGNSGRIIVSTHAYTPYDLCLGSNTDITSAKYTQFTSSSKKELDDMFASLSNKFTSKGIPVVMGEMGISNKNNNDARTAWASYYYTLGVKNGIPCVLWDNNAKNGTKKSENHWHFDRATLKWGDPDVIQAIMDAVGVSNPVIPPDDDVVVKQAQTVKIDNVTTKTFGDSAFDIKATASDGGTLSYDSSDTSVITVSSTGKATIKGAGTATVTVTAAETAKYKSGKATIDIKVAPKEITPTIGAIADQKYTGAEIKPTLSVKDGARALSSTNYTATFSNNVKPGTATVKVTLKGNYTGSATATFKIVSDGTTPVDPTPAAKTPSKVKISSYASNTTQIKLSWKKADNATGYAIYRYNDSTKKYKKIATVSSSKLTYLNSGLEPGKVYKYKVRAYNKTNGTVTWGTASNAGVTMTKPVKVVCTKAAKSASAVKLTWNAVTCSGYELQMYDAATGTWKTQKTLASTAKSGTVKGLKSGTTYKFRVRAFTKSPAGKYKYGSWSKTYSIKTK